jgi:hypothetical protein
MSDRPGKSRPMPAAPYDDPSIPVLTERLTLPNLDLDISLPAGGAPAGDPAQGLVEPEAVQAASPPAVSAAVEPPRPALLGAEFDSDTWLVETIPLAPPPLDLSTLDLPTFDLPPLSPAARSDISPTPQVEPPAAPLPVMPDAPEPGFAAADLVIPASLMRAPTTALPVSPASDAALSAAIEAAPTFDRLPAIATTEPLPTFGTPTPAAGAAFAVAPGAALPDEGQLREAILVALAQQLPQEVESILRRQLAPAIDAAVDAAAAQLAAEIRRAVAHSLRELVDHAVKAELAKLREPRSV